MKNNSKVKRNLFITSNNRKPLICSLFYLFFKKIMPIKWLFKINMQLNTMIKDYFYRLCFSVTDVNDKIRRKLVKKNYYNNV